MRIGGIYSFKHGREVLEADYSDQLAQVQAIIRDIDANTFKTKVSSEKTMTGRLLYDPRSLNIAFKVAFQAYGWQTRRVQCNYPTDFYTDDYTPLRPVHGAFREIDFVQAAVGVEVQFGKYAFMVYNVCAKMTIFHNMGIIRAGIEIVPLKSFADQMSTGVSYFEQIVWDLQKRGVADIDIPVLILGIVA